MFTRILTATFAAGTALVLSACGPAQTERWVVEDLPAYSGPRDDRSQGTYYVRCVPETDLAKDRRDRERWKEVEISPRYANDGTYDAGVRCPLGPVRDQYPPTK